MILWGTFEGDELLKNAALIIKEVLPLTIVLSLELAGMSSSLLPYLTLQQIEAKCSKLNEKVGSIINQISLSPKHIHRLCFKKRFRDLDNRYI